MCRMLQKIVDDHTPPCKGELQLAALTAGDRVPWAKARTEFFSKGKNKIALDAIEKASQFYFFQISFFNVLCSLELMPILLFFLTYAWYYVFSLLFRFSLFFKR